MKYYLVLCVFLMLMGFSVQGVAGDTGQITEIVSLSGDGILIANGEDQATITVNVVDSASGNPMPNLPITFTLNDPTLGALSITDIVTDSNGNADTVFTAGTKFGQAIVTVEIDYPETEPQQMVIKLTGYPDAVNISGSVDWLVAGQTSTSSLITVQAFNQSRPIPNLQVEFSVLNPSMGTITVSNGITDSDGKATTSFKPFTLSGVAQIQGVVRFTDEYITYTEPRIHEQKIDHAAPKEMDWYEVPSEIFVGDNTTVRVHYVDQYGNSIDNKRNPEYVKFSVTSPSTTSPNPPESVPAKFSDGAQYTLQNVTVELDENGFAAVDMRADTKAGNNRITVDPQFTGVNEYITILGIAESIPVTIEYDISTHSPPDPYPNIPADGESVFKILFTLKDKWGNPAGNRNFWMNTTLGEQFPLKTNSSGMVTAFYGKKIRTDIIDIQMTAVDAIDGTCATNGATVEITSLEPVQMSLTANPQYVPSWDVLGENTASIKAVVMDRNGNPVKNEIVELKIIPDWEEEYIDEDKPRWRDSEELTIELTTEEPHEDSVDAYASAEFRPGYFEGYGYPQKDDSCTIEAKWGSYEIQSVTISWTNVPFLSVTTNVNPAIASWDDTLEVNIKVMGNGYALRPAPIDAVLIIDTSGSMDERMGGYGTPTRLRAAKDAAKNFVGNMDVTPGRDQIALVSFSSDAMVVQGLTDDKDIINSSIESLSAVGGTNMRKAYYEAIKHLKDNGRDNALKAVILMSDGDWNAHGSPLAKGIGFPDTDSKLSTYDSAHYSQGIKLSSFPWNCYSTGGYTFNPGPCGVRNYPSGTTTYYEGYEWYSDLMDPKGTLSSQKYWYRRYNPGSHYWEYSWQEGSVCVNGQDTNQNMSVYANSGDENRQVKIYSLGFAQDLNDNVEADLTILSEAADGWYAWAGNEEELGNLYTNIVGELKIEAGVGVQMDLAFDDVKVSTNLNTLTMEGKEIFEYIPPTDERKYWFTDGTMIYHYPDRDDTDSWEEGEISFDIGTIKLNQAWESTFHLKVLENIDNVGRITLFDQGDTIQFMDNENNPYSLSLPTTYITCLGDQSVPPIGIEEVDYSWGWDDGDDPVKVTDDGYVTVKFERNFMVDGTPIDTWHRPWTENYYITIPGYLQKYHLDRVMILAPVPSGGSYTFNLNDLPIHLPQGVIFNFFFIVEGGDGFIDDREDIERGWINDDSEKILIRLR